MYEYTPGIAIDPSTGEEVADFNSGVFSNDAGKQAANAYHEQYQYNDYIGNEAEGYRHRYADLDPSIYEQYESDFQRQATYDDYFDGSTLTPEDNQYLQDSIGATEAGKDALLEWADNNLDPDDLAEYNEAIATGDIGLIEQWVQWLAATAQEQGFDYTLIDEYDYDPEEEAAYEEATNEFIESAFEHYGQENYQAATFWAYNNLPDHMISEYDDAMDNAPFEVRQQFVNELMGMFYQAQQQEQDDYYDDTPVAAHSNFY
jgi:hypothetical protein